METTTETDTPVLQDVRENLSEVYDILKAIRDGKPRSEGVTLADVWQAVFLRLEVADEYLAYAQTQLRGI